MSSYLFCDFTPDEFAALHQALSKVFNFTQDELKNLYHTMREEFEIADYPGDKPRSRSLFNSCDENFASRYDKALVIGVDIPSTFELADGNTNKKTIVMLGQDPLRVEDKRIDDILIGTPYGFHQKGCREKFRNTKFYFQLIKVLLDQGYRVYLTDVFKIWVRDSHWRYLYNISPSLMLVLVLTEHGQKLWVSLRQKQINLSFGKRKFSIIYKSRDTASKIELANRSIYYTVS